MLAYDYPFLDILWTMLIIFLWIMWFWLLIAVGADVFRRKDIGGGKKTLWLIFVIAVPFLGVFLYLITNNDGMTERSQKDYASQRAAADEYIRSVASTASPADQIAQAKQLLDSGAITQAEFDQIKAKALAS